MAKLGKTGVSSMGRMDAREVRFWPDPSTTGAHSRSLSTAGYLKFARGTSQGSIRSVKQRVGKEKKEKKGKCTFLVDMSNIGYAVTLSGKGGFTLKT